MGEHLLVSTECPTCGAPLDFAEGSTAVECKHCKSKLLVTGRTQVLSFYIRPRVIKEAALRVAAAECKGKITLNELYFIPYYRYTAHDYLCVAPGVAATSHGVSTDRLALLALQEEEEDFFDRLADHPLVQITTRKDLGQLLLDILDWLVEVIGTLFGVARSAARPSSPANDRKLPVPAIDASKARRIDFDAVEIATRHVEKNFIASRLKGSQLFSIGVRAAVLRLSLFRAEEVLQQGKLATVTIPVEEAHARGGRDIRRDTLLRATLSPSLNVIYFPYWLIDDERNAGLTIIDAVSGSIVERRVPESIVSELSQTSVATGATIGFRPLQCPNCGWELALRPHEVATLCTKCARAWQLDRNELRAIDSQIADVSSIHQNEPVTYLPFWVMESNQDGRKFFVPAFRYQSLKVLEQLAANLTGNQPQYEHGELRRGEIIGAYYDASDGKRLAEFLYRRARLHLRDAETSLETGASVLTWIPYRGKGAYFYDPFIGTNLYRNQIVSS